MQLNFFNYFYNKSFHTQKSPKYKVTLDENHIFALLSIYADAIYQGAKYMYNIDLAQCASNWLSCVPAPCMEHKQFRDFLL